MLGALVAMHTKPRESCAPLINLRQQWPELRGPRNGDLRERRNGGINRNESERPHGPASPATSIPCSSVAAVVEPPLPLPEVPVPTPKP